MSNDLREIWKSINISTLLILPLLQDFFECTTRSKPQLNYPILILMFEYGLIRTYYNHDSRTIKLVFFQEVVTSDLKLTNGSYYSLSERIIDCPLFINCESSEDLVVYTLKVPDIWYNDIDLIVKSKYSQVSSDFKDQMKIRQSVVPKTAHTKAHYLVKNNVSYAIVVKGKQLWKEISDTIGMDLPISQEFFTKYDPDREDFDYEFPLLLSSSTKTT